MSSVTSTTFPSKLISFSLLVPEHERQPMQNDGYTEGIVKTRNELMLCREKYAKLKSISATPHAFGRGAG